MMKTDNIRIKRKNSDFLLFGFLYLLLILIGVFLIGLPFLSFAPEAFAARAFLVILGILCVAAGGTLYGFLLYHGIRPQDALIITNKGFTNRLVGGKEGVYIEWINVASMKIFGLSKAPMLGLTLEDNEHYLSSLEGKDERTARANLEVGLPVIAIAQRDVFLSIGELKNLFSRMIKGAISWENYSTQGKKNEARPQTTIPAAATMEEPPEQKKNSPVQPETAEIKSEAVPVTPPSENSTPIQPEELSPVEDPEILISTDEDGDTHTEEIVLLDIDNE